MLAALLLAVRLVPADPTVPYKQPQLASAQGTLAVAFGAGNAVYVAASRDQGKTFAAPVKVAELTKLMLGRHRGPRIAILPRGAMVVSAIGDAGDLLAWRSADGGKTWSVPVRINDQPRAAREGLHAMAAGPDGALFAAWLDLRAGKTKLYGARSSDGGATWSPNALIYESPDGTICECCHPSVVIDKAGRVLVMWRNWLGGARDMYLARSEDGGKTFSAATKQGRGSWPLKACPMDGGGVAPDGTTAWRRESTVFLVRPGEPEQALGPGKDPAIASGPYVVWSNGKQLEVYTPNQKRVLAEDAAYPSLAGGDSVYAAWESGGAIAVERLN